MMEILTSRKNATIQRVRKLLSSRKARIEEGLFVADGTKLLAEAVKWWPGLKTVLYTPDIDLDVPSWVEKICISRELMEYVSPMETPQGALFVCALPEEKPLQVTPGMLLLDGIQDPGNLGTILRTADALEVPVVLLEGCADPYSHKVVRASMGAVFRTKPQQSTWQEVQTACKEAAISVAVTALSPKAKDIRQADLSQMAVVIGSEGQGVRKEIMASAQAELIIPMNEKCESLNAAVAATIVLWEMRK
jgi:TrmH family RNA methyltransferase